MLYGHPKWKFTQIVLRPMSNKVKLPPSALLLFISPLEYSSWEKFFLNLSVWWPLRLFYSWLCCTFHFHSLILFMLFFRDLYSEINAAWETEPRPRRFTSLLHNSFFLVAESIFHSRCFNASQLFYRHTLFYDEKAFSEGENQISNHDHIFAQSFPPFYLY